jgi:hypothetical protein
MTANFGASHQTSYVVTNLILDIVSSDKKYDTIRFLREEMASVLKQHNGQWSKTAITQ